MENYRLWDLAQFFNPAYAEAHLVPGDVRQLDAIKPLHHHNLIGGMEDEVHAYMAACVGVNIDASDHTSFTTTVLAFWRYHGHKFPTWSTAARIMFAMSPNSCAAERVFSLLKLYFGHCHGQLADYIEGSLMLAYNNAKRKSEAEAASA